MTTTTSTIAIATFAVYSILVLLLGLISQHVRSGKKSFVGEFFLCNRGLGTITFAMTFAATSASAGVFAGVPSLCYRHGWAMIAFLSGIMVCSLLVVGGLGKRMNQVARRANAVTVPDVLRGRFDSQLCGLFATSVIAIMLTIYLVPQYKLGAIILDELIGESAPFRMMADPFGNYFASALPAGVSPDYVLCLALFTLTVLSYVTFGGFRAVVWTDVMQGFVMVLGVGTLFFLAMMHLGSLESATKNLAELSPPKISELVFHQTSDSQASRIPAGTWIMMETAEEGQRLFRTNMDAYVSSTTPSRPIKSVEIVTPEEIDSIQAKRGDLFQTPGENFPETEIVSSTPYTHGKAGDYVVPPGPHPTSLAGFLPLMLMVSFLIYYPCASMGQPGDLLRLMAMDSSKTLKRAIPLLATVTCLIYLPIAMAFVYSRLIEPGLDADPDRIMPTLVRELCSGAGLYLITGMLYAAPFAAAMSTVDSFVLIITSSFVRDIYQNQINPKASEKTLKWMSYSCTCGVGLVAAIMAYNPPALLLMLIVFVGAGLTATFSMPFAIGLFWKRMNAHGCFAGMSLGLATHIGLHVPAILRGEGIEAYRFLGLEPVVWGVAASALACVFVSRLTPAPPRSLVEKYFGPPQPNNSNFNNTSESDEELESVNFQPEAMTAQQI